jgi:ADP-ribose pyrophosphatase YjhB (NUDIX family)
MDKKLFQIRATAILIEDGKILIVKQKLNDRNWSLSGGRVEAPELLGDAVIRECREETGLNVKVIKLLYVCDKPDSEPAILHITFLVERVSGNIILPSNKYDENPISDVKFVAISELSQYGFSKQFIEKINNNFIDSGNYMGLKKNIGL